MTIKHTLATASVASLLAVGATAAPALADDSVDRTDVSTAGAADGSFEQVGTSDGDTYENSSFFDLVALLSSGVAFEQVDEDGDGTKAHGQGVGGVGLHGAQHSEGDEDGSSSKSEFAGTGGLKTALGAQAREDRDHSEGSASVDANGGVKLHNSTEERDGDRDSSSTSVDTDLNLDVRAESKSSDRDRGDNDRGDDVLDLEDEDSLVDGLL